MKKYLLVLAVAVSVAGCAGYTYAPAPQAAALTAEQKAALEADVLRIKSSLQSHYNAAKADCTRGGTPEGLMVWNKYSFRESLRASAINTYGVGSQLEVGPLDKGSTAATSGLQPGDKIIYLNLVEIPLGQMALPVFLQTYTTAMQNPQPELKFLVTRNGRFIEEDMKLPHNCKLPDAD